MLTFKAHNGTEHDFDALPPASRNGMLSRAVAHVFGNEVASQVVGFIRSQVAESTTAAFKAEGSDKVLKASEVSTDQVKAFRDANPDLIDRKTAEFQDAKLAAILEGTLGVRSASGMAISPLDREMLRIAREEIRGVFKAKGWTWPTKEATFKVGETELDADGWTERWLDVSNDKQIGGKGDPNRPRIERMANRNLKAKADQAKAIANAAQGAEQVEGL